MIENLLVPRKKIYFAPEPGEFVPLNGVVPDQLKQPMVRSSSGFVQGRESGKRSGLLSVEGQLFKAKGCAPNGRLFHNGPYGSQTYSLARYEAERTLEIREAYLREGLEFPLEPVGFWRYDGYVYHGEPNAATVYKTAGDTRIDELRWWIERVFPRQLISEEERDLIDNTFTALAVLSGRVLGFLHKHQFTWDSDHRGRTSNAHDGNLVIFPGRDGNLRMAAVDHDNTLNHSIVSDDEISEADIRKRELDNLRNSILRRTVISRARVVNYDPYEALIRLVSGLITKIAPSFDRDLLVAAKHWVLYDLRDKTQQAYYTGILEEGFDLGYGSNGKVSDVLNWKGIAYLAKKAGSRLPRRDLVKRAEEKVNEISVEGIKEPTYEVHPFRIKSRF